MKKRFYRIGPAFVLIAAVAFYSLRQAKQADRIHALSNLRHISHKLLEFESQYGRSPDDSTLTPVKAQDETGLKLGTKTSNDYFRQLLATTGSGGERIYFANILRRSFYPNDLVGPRALERDECSFSYIPGLS